MHRNRLLGGCLVSLGLVAAGCGGSSSTPLSSTQLAAKVNAACRSYVKASSAVPQPGGAASNLPAAAAYLEKLKPLVESEHATIASLRPAPELRAQFNQFLAASTHQLGLFESALSKLQGRDATGLRDLLRAARYKRTVLLPLEHTLGFTACQK